MQNILRTLQVPLACVVLDVALIKSVEMRVCAVSVVLADRDVQDHVNVPAVFIAAVCTGRKT